MQVVCYIDTNDIPKFATAIDYEEWADKHPNFNIIHVFDKNGDILTRKDNIENSFIANCSHYNMVPAMLHTTFINEKGEECKILGMKPRNNRYKFIIGKSNGKTYKVTDEYITKNYNN